MKLKFNWGTGITIFIILFISFYVFLIFFTKSKVFYMVSDKYYPESIVFEKQIEKTRHARALNEKIIIKIVNDTLILKLPSWNEGNTASGSFLFYKPDDAKEDVIVPVNVNPQGIQYVYPSGLVKGRYILKADWKMNDTAYYDEISVYIQ